MSVSDWERAAFSNDRAQMLERLLAEALRENKRLRAEIQLLTLPPSRRAQVVAQSLNPPKE